MSRILAGAPVAVLASYTTIAQKPPGRVNPPLSASQIRRCGAAMPWMAWKETIAASRDTAIRTLDWERMKPPLIRPAVRLPVQNGPLGDLLHGAMVPAAWLF